MKKYIMALDQGTTSSRCVLYNKYGEVVSTGQKETRQIYPNDGWVEQDPMEIWSTQMGVAQEALFKINATYNDVAAIGITNQRETTVVWDKKTGQPVYNAIVWQCRRTAEYCDAMKDRGLSEIVRNKTGLIPDAYFSGTKLRWILENIEGARERANRGDLIFGTIETWIIWKLTEGRVHVTDYSNASRTMMFNIHRLDWDDELLEILDIPLSMLPRPVSCSEVYGYTEARIFGGKVPIAGASGDQQASLFGQTCFEEGEGKMTYGTGGFMLLNTGKQPVFSRNGLITTVAWGINGKVYYALEGSVFVAGAAVQWLRDDMELLENAAESESLSMSVENNGGVVVVPALTGLGAPYWDPYARGAIFGITRGTKKAHLVRATLESLAYQTKDLADAMTADTGSPLKSLQVDGGGAANNFIVQFQADILGQDIYRPCNLETTSLGAAYFAGLAVGYWPDQSALQATKTGGHNFRHKMNQAQTEQLLEMWHRAVDRTLNWIQ